MIALPASVKVCGWVASLANSTTFFNIWVILCYFFC
jgi:hypothetical protein